MKKWKKIRIGLIIFVFLQGLLLEGAAPPPSDAPLLILPIIFVFGLIGMPFIIGIQAINPASNKPWKRPGWDSNFLSTKNPINLFYLFSIIMFTLGLGVIFRHIIYKSYIGPDTFFFFALSSGLYLGIKLCTILFTKSFEEPNK